MCNRHMIVSICSDWKVDLKLYLRKNIRQQKHVWFQRWKHKSKFPDFFFQ